jgi:hypothetical protein
MGGLSHVEQVRCHEQNMSQDINYLTHLIFEGFQTHPQIMKLITDTTKKYLLNYSHSRNPRCERTHGCTDKSKRPESHPTKECVRVCVRCL